MRIVAIETNNFKGLKGHREFPDLPDGVIGVAGDNGKGKSTLMSAVAYAFFGPEVLDTGNADVVTWGEKEAWVNVWFWMDGGWMLHRRTDGKNTKATLEKEGEPYAQSATEVTAVMQELLGIDRVGFLASVFSKQEDLLGIGSLQPAKRQSTVLRLLQFDKIERALKNLSETNRDLNKEVSTFRMAVKPVAGVDPAVIEKYEQDRVRLIAERDEYSTASDYLYTQMKRLEEGVEAYNLYAGKKNKLQGELDAAREAMTRAFKEAEQALPPMPVAPNNLIDPAKYEFQLEDAKRAEATVKNSICPTCKRPFDEAGSKEAATYLDNAMQWLRENEAAYQGTLAYNKANVLYERMVEAQKEAQGRAEKAQSLVMDKMDHLDELVPVENPKEKWDRAHEAWRSADRSLNTAKSNLVQVETSLQHMRDALARQKEQEEQYAQIEAETRRLEHEILVNGNTELLMKQFKNNLIASVIPTITERASSLITEMTEGKYTELSLTPQYDIEYRNDQGDLKSFANLSGGEKDVFALALRLAIADLKAGSIGMLVLDEVLESLDPGRQEATWEALLKLTNRYSQIFVITHVDNFKDRAPYTIQV